MRRIGLLLAVSFGLFAQNATVYDLTPAESSEGARLYKAMNAAEDAYHAWQGRINKKFKANDGACFSVNTGGYTCGTYLEFTDDFKHAVPKAPAPQQSQGYHPPCLGVAW